MASPALKALTAFLNNPRGMVMHIVVSELLQLVWYSKI